MLIIFISSFSKPNATYARPIYLDFVFLVTTLFLIITLFANLYRWTGLRSGKDITHDLWDGIYFSITSITTVGFGDEYPAESHGRIFAAIEALSGYFLLAFLANSILDLIKGGHKARN